MGDEGLEWEGEAHLAEADCRATLAGLNSLAADK